jgi:2-haloacid dehalogenase
MLADVSAVVFDAYGTIFDVHSVTRLADTLFPGRGAQLSATWRAKQLETTWLRSLMGRYEDFSKVTDAALDWSLESLGLVADAKARGALNDEYRRLATFPDAEAALARLSRSHRLAILSNGHPDMLDAVVDHARLRERFAGGVLSVDAAGIFKPAPSVYQLAVDALDLPADRIGFVSSNGWDAAGAKAFGFRVCWINRGKAPRERLGVVPDITVASLDRIE